MNPDAIVRLRFLTSAEGGRSTGVRGPFYNCPLIVGGSAFDCRMLLNEHDFKLGNTYEVGVKFLDSERALQALPIGTKFAIWEGRKVGSGEVVALLPQDNLHTPKR